MQLSLDLGFKIFRTETSRQKIAVKMKERETIIV